MPCHTSKNTFSIFDYYSQILSMKRFWKDKWFVDDSPVDICDVLIDLEWVFNCRLNMSLTSNHLWMCYYMLPCFLCADNGNTISICTRKDLPAPLHYTLYISVYCVSTPNLVRVTPYIFLRLYISRLIVFQLISFHLSISVHQERHLLFAMLPHSCQ